jgi:hypothetical protein
VRDEQGRKRLREPCHVLGDIEERDGEIARGMQHGEAESSDKNDVARGRCAGLPQKDVQSILSGMRSMFEWLPDWVIAGGVVILAILVAIWAQRIFIRVGLASRAAHTRSCGPCSTKRRGPRGSRLSCSRSGLSWR